MGFGISTSNQNLKPFSHTWLAQSREHSIGHQNALTNPLCYCFK